MHRTEGTVYPMCIRQLLEEIRSSSDWHSSSYTAFCVADMPMTCWMAPSNHCKMWDLKLFREILRGDNSFWFA